MRIGSQTGVRTAARRRLRSLRGFTLVEVLVVIIIAAILMAIAIPTYFRYRANAQDSAAVNLVRNGLTVVQTGLADHGNYLGITEVYLEGLETNMDWILADDDLVTVGGSPGIDDSVIARAEEGQILFYVESGTRIDIASRSASESWFGMQIDTLDQIDTGYIKVKVIGGTAEEGW